MLHELEQPFEIFGQLVRMSASVGIAIAGPEHKTAAMLVRDADFAMNRAKMDGGGCSEVYDSEVEMPHKKSLQDPEQELRRVLEKHLYEVWYQPIYKLNTGDLEGFESLLRLRRPDGSIESFRRLLGVAEDTGLSITLGRETMDTVCRQLRNWADGVALRDLTLTLNLTERQFYHPDMLKQLRKALFVNGVDPERLLFEVAEGTINLNLDLASTILAGMADTKIRIAVDNFGARFAPLNHLARLPIHVIKLAPRLTTTATGQGRQTAVLESLVHLAQALGMQVIAQGIETPEQLYALNQMGCDLGQGHLFAYALEPGRATILAGSGHWSMAQGA